MTLPLLADPPLVPDPPPPAPTPWPITPQRPCQQPAGHTCHTCGGPVASLLAGCWKPECLRADLDYDAHFDNQDW
ncbi:hypothetical protein QQG74_09940 [Micromonospora sp. FIMYZ51]|uniref:hypothetical protein n=1 Tax=Micromonospora sp. FIMYZ51 TaxID=3051832 RepID=UPI00311ECB40